MREDWAHLQPMMDGCTDGWIQLNTNSTDLKNQVAHTTTHVLDPCSNLIVHVPSECLRLLVLVPVQP